MNENKLSGTSPKKTEKKVRFNFIDFLLIVIVLAIIASLVYVFLLSSLVKNITADETVEIQYTLELMGIDEKYLENIKEGDVVLDSVSNSNIGTVEAIDYSPQHADLVYDEENKVGILSPIAGRHDVVVTISATARYEAEDGYSVNGTRIAVGEKISARFPNYVCECYCISVPLD